MSIASDVHKLDFDTCAMCTDAKMIALPTGERYRVCAPKNWKSYECAAKQLVALKEASSPR